jgi:CheY-like chemotaxis protein
MALGEDQQLVLVLDDEPEYLTWVADFLRTLDLDVQFVRTLPEAIAAISERVYRLILVDMNVPAHSAIEPAMRERTPLVDKYPGLVLAVRARSAGYGQHSVIAYTVHDDDAIEAEMARLRCRYVLKGRPADFKAIVENAIKPAAAKKPKWP